MQNTFNLSADLKLSPAGEFSYFTQYSAGTKYLVIAPQGWIPAEHETLSVAFERADGSFKLDPIQMGKVREKNLYYTVMPTEVMHLYGEWSMCIYLRFNYDEATGMATAQEVGEKYKFNVVETIRDDSGKAVTKYDLANISALQKELENGGFAARGLYPWKSEFVYLQGEIAFYERVAGKALGAIVKSAKEGENTTEPYDAEGNLQDGWELEVDFNNIKDEYFLELQDLVGEAEEHKDAATAAQAGAEAARGEAERQAIRAENAAANLENVIGDAIEYVAALPDIADAQFGKMYAVVSDADSNFFDLYTLEHGEDGELHFRSLGSENILANGLKVYTFELVADAAWVANRQTFVIPEYDPAFHVDLFPADESAVEYLRCGVRVTEIADDGTVTFSCTSAPAANLKVIVRVNVQFELPSVAGYYTKPQTDALMDEERKARAAADEQLHQEIVQAEHFKGYFGTNAAIAAIETADENDYAWSAESHTVWIYGKEGWEDSQVPVPDQTVPPGDTVPLMDSGKGEIGVATKYARADHRHPENTNKADVSALEAEAGARGLADSDLQNQLNDIQAIPLDEIVGMFNE